VVGHLAEVLGCQHSVAELVQHVGMDPLDGVDQLVEPDGCSDDCRTRRGVGHSVNVRLTITVRQPWVDEIDVRAALTQPFE
jgi:hypothetical protein